MIELRDTRRDARKFESGHRALEAELRNLSVRVYGKRDNERLLRSRNKREGWYYERMRGYKVQIGNESRRVKTCYLRTHTKDFGLRYRKQSGAQIFYPKAR